MSWLDEDKRNWRRLFLVLLFVAMIGPWFFDRVSVPGPHSCSAIRLDKNFCGIPTTGLWIFLYAFGALFNAGRGLFTPSMDFATWNHIFVGSVLMLLLLLPFLTTLFSILRVNQRRWHLCQIVVLGLAAASAGLLMVLPSFFRPHWMLWGPWLYICLAISMLLWEALAFYDQRKMDL